MDYDAFSLPPDSQYHSMDAVIRQMFKGGALGHGTSPEAFADSLVKDVLNGKTSHTYTGAMAWVVPYIKFFPKWYYVRLPLPPRLKNTDFGRTITADQWARWENLGRRSRFNNERSSMYCYILVFRDSPFTYVASSQ